MNTEKTEPAIVVQTTALVTTTPNDLVKIAVERGLDADALGKLLALQERWEDTQARKAYVQAMAAFKSNPPAIFKDRTVSAGKASYKHASLGNVIRVCTEALGKHGLTASWQTDQTDQGAVRVTCVVTHEGGHAEQTTLVAPSDNSGNKNPIQAVGSTVTYLQRYTLLALLGLATEDQDNDGRGVTGDVTVANEEQRAKMRVLLADPRVKASTRLTAAQRKWAVGAVGNGKLLATEADAWIARASQIVEDTVTAAPPVEIDEDPGEPPAEEPRSREPGEEG